MRPSAPSGQMSSIFCFCFLSQSKCLLITSWFWFSLLFFADSFVVFLPVARRLVNSSSCIACDSTPLPFLFSMYAKFPSHYFRSTSIHANAQFPCVESFEFMHKPRGMHRMTIRGMSIRVRMCVYRCDYTDASTLISISVHCCIRPKLTDPLFTPVHFAPSLSGIDCLNFLMKWIHSSPSRNFPPLPAHSFWLQSGARNVRSWISHIHVDCCITRSLSQK